MLQYSKHIKRQFEKSMKDYDKNAVVQDWTASKMLDELIKYDDYFENILELGSGTGLLTRKIAQLLKYKNFFANDLVEESKICVQKFIPNANFLCGNALKIRPSKKFDLIISNAVFQWFNRPDKAVQILKLLLNQNGILSFSTFSLENFKEIKEITGLSLEYKSKEEIEKILAKNGFEIIYSKTFRHVLKFNTPLELLAHMKNTGVNSLTPKTWSIKKVKEFCEEYSKKYPDTHLTYSPVIIITRL